MQTDIFTEGYNEEKPKPKKKRSEILFDAPKNIALGMYYVSKTGQVIYTLHYVATGMKNNAPVVSLFIRVGRTDYEYKNTDPFVFSEYIASGKLVACH